MGKYCLTCVCMLFCFYFSVYGQKYNLQQIDSARHILKNYGKDSEVYFKTCLFISNCYADRNDLDTSQIWLDIIADNKETRKKSRLYYLYRSAQVKIYYSRNLHHIGINETREILSLAHQLNDSLLLQDAYAMLGFFYYNIDSPALSRQYLNKALTYDIGLNSGNISLFGRYEIYSGFLYNYIRLKDWNSSLLFAQKCLQLVSYSTNFSAIAESYNAIQLNYYRLNQMDSSLFYSIQLDSLSGKTSNKNFALLACLGYVKYYDTIHNYNKVLEYFKKGIELIKSDEELNPPNAQEFLYVSIKRLKKYQWLPDVIEALELSRDLAFKVLRNSQVQTNGIENAALRKEARILEAELNATNQRQRSNGFILTAIILFLLLISIVLLMFLYHQKQKLKGVEMKERLSRDLHDDIGASLSSISIYGDLAQLTLEDQPDKGKEMVRIISQQSKDLMERMGDIIWSMKPASEDRYTLEARLKNYCTELLSPKNIVAKFDIDDKLVTGISNPEVRKNILLIAKEAINNIAKYSRASTATICFKQHKSNVQLIISDNGKGFANNKIKDGNGIGNIKSRSALLNGNCTIDNGLDKGVTITCSFPIATISHNQ